MSSNIDVTMLPVLANMINEFENRISKAARQRLKVRIYPAAREVSETALQTIICEAFSVSWIDIIGKSRMRNVCEARHSYCYFARRKLNLTHKQIGDSLNRDHTSVIHAIDAVEALLFTNDQAFCSKILEVEERLSHETEAKQQ